MTKMKSGQNQFEGMTIGGYKICHEIGKGYSGYVHLAEKKGKEYAVKIIKPELTSDIVNEKKQLVRINIQKEISRKIIHPNIIRIIDGGKCIKTKYLYLVMEYLSSKEYTPLNKWSKKLSLENIRLLLSQIASAAENLHEYKYTHRDIKPSNIMISNKGDKAVLLDLGVVKSSNYKDLYISENKELSHSYSKEDAFRYMSLTYAPKELIDKNVLAGVKNYKPEAISLYQLGAILLVLMSGKQLFSDKDWVKIPSAILKGISKNDLDKELRSNIYPDDLKNLALRLLDKNWKTRLQVEWKDFNFENYVPTLVFLHAGGTIGSKEKNGGKKRGLRDSTRENKDFFDKITERIELDYKQIYEPENDFPFKIEWESLEKKDLILSENATPIYWNAIMKKLEKIIKKYGSENIENEITGVTEKNNKYLAGIIILHGTDTLAYTASALTFGMKNLPCPILITGSNQPPNEDDLNEVDTLSSKSDVWKNLGLATNFIRCFGHRYTELFIAFNSTIFHSYNLKKVPLHNAFELGNSVESAINEPYTYQNIYLPRKFMFKWIDGFFCNNFYPIYKTNYNDLINGRLHTRDEINMGLRKFEITEFSKKNLELIVCTPVSDYNEINLENKEAIVLVGYDSGTFPSVENHGLSKHLIEWTKQGKLIFLITEFGLFPSDGGYSLDKFAMSNNKKERIRTIKLFGLIKEAAVPFILHLLSKLEKDKSNIKSSKTPFEEMNALLTSQDWKNSMPGIVINQPFDYVKLQQLLKDHMKDVRQEYHSSESNLFKSLESKLGDDSSKKYFKNKANNFPESKQHKNDFQSTFTVNFPPELSQWFILRKCKKSFALGYGPTAFKELNDMGFKFGRIFFNHVSAVIKSKTKDIEDKEIWVELKEEKRKEETLNKIEGIVAEFSSRLGKMGIVGTSQDRCFIVKDAAMSKGIYIEKPPSILIKVDTFQKNTLEENKIFAVTQFDNEELDFFTYLKNGTPFNISNNEYRLGARDRLLKLARNTWNETNIQPVEWLILGIFKGLMVESILALSFDRWVKGIKKSEDHTVLIKQFLKNSISTNITQSEHGNFNFEMKYLERKILDKNKNR